ncbi:MAG: hypothetical protein AVDCRST_MAG64-769, partial [uncultured Phycisphaerae bacterium]
DDEGEETSGASGSATGGLGPPGRGCTCTPPRRHRFHV